MSARDLFTIVPSTHHLLVGILLTETGLFGVGPLHQESQHLWIVESFLGIQKRLASSEWEEKSSIALLPFKDIGISRRDDAKLFLKLYKGINSLAELEVSAVTQVEQVAYPLVTEMVLGNPKIRGILSAEYCNHLAEYGEPASGRMKSYLDGFGLQCVHSSENSVNQQQISPGG